MTIRQLARLIKPSTLLAPMTDVNLKLHFLPLGFAEHSARSDKAICKLARAIGNSRPPCSLTPASGVYSLAAE